MIKTWQQRCDEHPDHNGIVTERMIQARMQEEIDELRAALEQRQWQGLTADEIWDAWCEQAKPERDTKGFVAAFARVVEAKLKAKNS